MKSMRRLLWKKGINNLFIPQTRHLVLSYLKALIIISTFAWKFSLENPLSFNTQSSILKMKRNNMK